MIQRIQSVYLFLTTLLSCLFLRGSFLSFINKTGDVIKFTFTGILKSTEGLNNELIENVLPFTLVLILIAVLSFITIFLFKNRNIQLLFAKILIVLVSCLILVSGYYSYVVIAKYNGTIQPGVKMALPLILFILSILAHRGIKKDDQMVKSYDRLR